MLRLAMGHAKVSRTRLMYLSVIIHTIRGYACASNDCLCIHDSVLFSSGLSVRTLRGDSWLGMCLQLIAI